MASTCIHGYTPGTCLICQTLDGPKDAGAKKAARARHPDTAVALPSPVPRPPRSLSASRLRSGPRVVPKEAPRTSAPAVLKLAALAVAIIAVIVVAWTVLHIVFAVLHVLELAGVALLAGYLGWLAGVHHGRTARRE